MLDLSTRAGIATTLRSVATERGLAVIFVTHDLGEAVQSCDRIVVLRSGSIVEHGASGRLCHSPEHPYTAETPAGGPHRMKDTRMPDVFARLESFGDRYRLETDLSSGTDWIGCNKLLDPWSEELGRVLEAERVASGQVSDHATALTVMAVYAGTVTASALLAWALEDVVVDMRPSNVVIRRSAHHGFEAVGLREPRVVDAGVDTLISWVLDGHLLPLARAMRVRTRAGLRQLNGGVAHGCAAAFCIASRRGGDVDLLERAYQKFLAGSTGGIDALGKVSRLRENNREGLFYLRNTCCLYYTSAEAAKCSSCCLDPAEERIANYRRVLADGVVPH